MNKNDRNIYIAEEYLNGESVIDLAKRNEISAGRVTQIINKMIRCAAYSVKVPAVGYGEAKKNNDFWLNALIKRFGE